MGELTISGKKLLKWLIKNNAKIIRQKGSHCFVRYNGKSTIIPLHSNIDLPKGTIRKIMKDLNLGIDDIKQAK